VHTVGATGVVECLIVRPLPDAANTWRHTGGGLFVATGGVDSKVHVYTLETPHGSEDALPRLVHAISLTGHLDWIRSIDISSAGMIRFGSRLCRTSPPLLATTSSIGLIAVL
jgi:hypothetical protein